MKKSRNTNHSKEDYITQCKIQSNNINSQETRRPQVVVNEFLERQHTFQRQKIVPSEWPYSEATNSRVYNNNNIIVFSDSIASFTRNIRSNFKNELKESRARFKYFSGSTPNDLLFYIGPTPWRGQFDTAIIHIGINDSLSNIAGTYVLLQNILNIAARCKMYGINKIFVSNVLNTDKFSSDLIAKLNLDISNICKITYFILLVTITYQTIYCIRMAYILQKKIILT